jgi:hypothetical protein
MVLASDCVPVRRRVAVFHLTQTGQQDCRKADWFSEHSLEALSEQSAIYFPVHICVEIVLTAMACLSFRTNFGNSNRGTRLASLLGDLVHTQ